LSSDRILSSAIRKAKQQGIVPLLADIKPQSPRDGNLVKGKDPVDLARTLSRSGACALSVVTESTHFGGSLHILRDVARAISLPVLRKDFISSVEQVEESKEAGAAAVLLILATTPESLVPMLDRRIQGLGMEAVVEIHTRRELDLALTLSPILIGINNRDILRLEQDEGDVALTEELVPLVPRPILTISESSLNTPEEVRRAIQAGADAVLIGTAILQSDDPGARVKDLVFCTKG
jgi:indole-3-glycerol phosphate synthase